MFIPKEHRVAVFSYLFKEGVLVVKKDTRSQTHPQIEGPTNLEVLMLVKSLESRGYVRVTFSWQYHYVYLTDAGIEYLRQYLALPAEIVPATHKKQATRPDMRDREEDRDNKFSGGRPAFRGDRGEYRGREGGEYRGREGGEYRGREGGEFRGREGGREGGGGGGGGGFGRGGGV